MRGGGMTTGPTSRAQCEKQGVRTDLIDHVAALPRLLSNDEAEALADCTACSSCLVSVLPVSSEWSVSHSLATYICGR